MAGKRPRIDADDIALFRDAVGPVRRIEPAHAPERPRREPEARSREADEAEARAGFRERPLEFGDPNAAEPLAFRGPRIAEKQFRRLKRGQFAVQDEIDLHHLRATEAEAVLRAFLHDARRRGHGCVRIVHGKGRRSRPQTGPVLKALVDRMLSRREDVLAYASAPPAMGGTGAVLVLLAPRRAGEQAGPAQS